MNFILNNLNTYKNNHDILTFKLPIEFCEHSNVNDNIISDLELFDGENSLYSKILFSDDKFKNLCIKKISTIYSTDKSFLKDTQKILLNKFDIIPDYDEIMELRDDIDKETGFIEKYNYVDWANLKFLNNNSQFLQALSLYEMTSPVLSLALPIFLLIIPFFIIRLQGYKMNISTYIDVLKSVLSRHSIGQIFSLTSASWDKRIYAIISIIFYFVQVYYNIQSCIKFTNNFKIIHKRLFVIKEYFIETEKSMRLLIELLKEYPSYTPFIIDINKARNYILEIINVYKQITPCSVNIKKINEIGLIMKCYYQLYNEEWIISTLDYAMQYNSYINVLKNINLRITSGEINKCIFSNKTSMKEVYYPHLINDNYICNNIKLNKNIIITGPNAAGKTTILKTVLSNLLFSQQFGYGFYKQAKIKIYNKFHCYINIPDTSGRDSLFQAEARRCREIIEHINNNDNHFCIFDELFSGTNPYEAIASATGFLSYLNKNKKVDYIITTHFLDICKRLNKDDNNLNYSMEVIKNNNQLKYTYKLKKDISNIKGGINVLETLSYPKEIINNAINIINELNL